ncbi:unnamed protein product [Dibothriocephalus latus]|uniref:Fibronectin type-III domain-containing protein n=1 Tax=Dibothriocephalus latus TaxID=60516 RepID=A0A3P7LN56_DIBLA|nr:unnamed protein product [Dibothriocephalus latus]
MILLYSGSQRKLTKTSAYSPKTFTADAVGSTSIKFVWTLPNQTLDNLIVIAQTISADSGGSKTVAAKAGETTVVVEDLKPLTTYTATLLVSNANANAKDTSEDEHLVLTAPNPPTISIPTVGGTWIQVKFEPMPGGDAMGLVYSAETTDESGGAYGCSVKSSNQDAVCTIEQLQPSKDYTITAKACVGTTCSEAAPAQHVTTDNKAPATETTMFTTLSTTASTDTTTSGK